MIANYHTHTWRCNHAGGREEDYVRNAIARKFEILGFSDHTPYIFPGTYESGFRMLQNQLQDYCHVVRNLQKQFAGQIRIPLGVEMEYYPAYFNETLKVLQDAGIEYLLLGQHFVGNEIGEHYGGWLTDQKGLLTRYCDQTMEAMQTGLFTYLAHPDLMYIQTDDPFYKQQMRRLCREAKSCNIPLEINLAGMRVGKNYPDIRFWEVAAEEGNQVVIGCDAHSAVQAWDPEYEALAMEMVKKLGLNLLETVDLRPIR